MVLLIDIRFMAISGIKNLRKDLNQNFNQTKQGEIMPPYCDKCGKHHALNEPCEHKKSDSRKIKFRAWVGKVKHKCVAVEFGPDGIERWKSGRWFSVTKDVTIEQFTGLKDKDGIGIFEGDILKLTRKNELWYPEVRVDYGDVIFRNGKYQANFQGKPDSWTYLRWEVEIVSNIHENKDIYPFSMQEGEQGGCILQAVDIPEALTEGGNLYFAKLLAEEALLLATEFYTEDKKSVPSPSKPIEGCILILLKEENN